MSDVSMEEIHSIICSSDENSAAILVKVADRFGQELKSSGLTTNQIRSVFGEVRNIEAEWDVRQEDKRKRALRQFILLRPKLAYRSRRERGRAVQMLAQVLDAAIIEVINEKEPAKQFENFQHFVDFFEAILAYHKAYGGN